MTLGLSQFPNSMTLFNALLFSYVYLEIFCTSYYASYSFIIQQSFIEVISSRPLAVSKDKVSTLKEDCHK